MKSILEIAPLASKDTIALNPHLNPVQGNVKRFRGILKGIIEGNPPHETNDQRQIPNTVPEPTVCNESLGTSKGKESHPKRCIISITSFRVQLTDPDNLCPKYFIDALRYAGAFRDDREEDIELHTRQEKVKSYKDEKTVIEVTL